MGMAGRVAFRFLGWLIQRVADAALVGALTSVLVSSGPSTGIFPAWTFVVTWMVLSGYALTTLIVVLTGVSGRLIPYAITHAVLFFVHLFVFLGVMAVAGSPQSGLPILLFVLGPVAALVSALVVRGVFGRLFA